jgi:hypothetical protein
MKRRLFTITLIGLALAGHIGAGSAVAQRTVKPVLHGKHWVAATGKPLAATAGALTFAKGGNAVDAACAMLAATSTMWDTLGWGGETQALVYNPETGKVIGVNALGVAPTGATTEFFRQRGDRYPPEYGPLAAVTPGTPGPRFWHRRSRWRTAIRSSARKRTTWSAGEACLPNGPIREPSSFPTSRPARPSKLQRTAALPRTPESSFANPTWRPPYASW